MPTPLPVIPSAYYGYVWMSFRGRRYGSIFSWLVDVSTTDPTTDAQYAQYVADALVSSWNTNMLPRYPNGTTGTDSKVYPLGHPLLPAAVSHAAAAAAGSDEAAAASAAAVIRHVVDRRGRGSQSHTAISPLNLSEVEVNGDNVTDAFVTNMDTDIGNFIGGVQAAFATSSGGPTISYVQVSKKHAATFRILRSGTEKALGTERSRTLRP